MVSLDSIEREITELETRDTSYATVERLAWLYICRDHLRKDVIQEAERIQLSSQTEFSSCCCGKQIESVLAIIEEHLTAVRAIYPKEYDAVIEKINALAQN